MVKQYVGARYVPKFASPVEWAGNTSYEALTIVTFNNASYTSKVPVPPTVGNPANNPQYWALTGNYNAQVEEYRKEVEESKEDYEKNIKIIDDIQNNLTRKVIFPVLPLLQVVGTSGSCCCLTYGEHATIIDLGLFSSTFNSIKNNLTDAGITTIDNIIITHYHIDHTGADTTAEYDHAYDSWKNNFNMDDTVFWVPRINAAGTLSEGLDRINQSFPNNTVNTLDNGSLFTWNDISFTCYNASASDYAYYDANTSYSSNYNNYSAIIYATYGNTILLNTGDVSTAAQEHCCDEGYVRHADIVTIPHHGTDPQNIASDFMMEIKPLYAYISSITSQTGNGYRDTNIAVASRTAIAIFDNFSNLTKPVTFTLTPNGVIAEGTAISFSDFSNDSRVTVYCNPSIDESQYQDGSKYHPYKYIRRAISSCKGQSTIELLNDITDTSIVITGSNGDITLNGNNHTVAGMYIVNGAKVDVNNITLTSLGVTDAHIHMINCTITKTITSTNGFMHIRSCTFTSTEDEHLITLSNSFVIILYPTASTSTATHLIYGTDSFVSGAFGIALVGSKKIRNARGYTNLGRLDEEMPIISSIFGDADSPVFMFDKTNNRIVHYDSTGKLYAVAMTEV